MERVELRNWQRLKNTLPLSDIGFRSGLEAAFNAKHYEQLFAASRSLKPYGYKITIEGAEIYLERIAS